MILFERFEAVALQRRECVAILHEQRAISYGELLDSTRSFAVHLSRELAPDSVLGLCIQEPGAFVATYLAAAAIGAKIVLVDPREVPELARQIDQFELTHLVGTKREWGHLAGCVTGARHVDVRSASLILGEVKAHLRSKSSNYRLGDFVVQCTSGSMGSPKGIVLSQQNMLHRVLNWAETLGLSETDTTLCSLTLAHSHGIDVLMLPGLLTGGRVVVPDLERLSPRRVVRAFREHAVSIFSSLPYFYELMLDTVPPEHVDLRGLRHLVSGSAPLSVRTALAFRDRFGRGIQQVYGLSEIGPICLNRDPEQVGVIGEFVVGVSGRIEDEGAHDQGGELVVSGKALARGYLNSPEAERTFFRDSRLWTQDIVAHGPQGFKIVGRRSRFINCGGNKVDPVEVEHVLCAHPGVLEAVVAGSADALRGEQIVAYVKARERLTVEDLHGFACARLALHKVPSKILFVGHIPKNGLGKVQISTLVESTRGASEEGR